MREDLGIVGTPRLLMVSLGRAVLANREKAKRPDGNGQLALNGFPK